MNFTKTLGIAILGLLSVEAFAQTEPFYKIEVVNQGSYDYAYGPYATVLSEGANPKAGSILLKNNMFSYFNILVEYIMGISFYTRYLLQPLYPSHPQVCLPNSQEVYKLQIVDGKYYTTYRNARKHNNSVRSELRSFLL